MIHADNAGVVRVSVVCPGGVVTPILDKQTPADLPVPSADGIDSRALITKMSGGWLYDPDALAGDILRGIERNRAIIVAPRQARLLWRLMRLSPSLLVRLFTAIDARSTSACTSAPGLRLRPDGDSGGGVGADGAHGGFLAAP